MMRAQTGPTALVVAFAPKEAPIAATMAADDAGQHIVALVQKASDIAKAECQRAMDLAQRVSSQLRAAEERAREFEAEAIFSGPCRLCGRMARSDSK
jgi:hypothetical protein